MCLRVPVSHKKKYEKIKFFVSLNLLKKGVELGVGLDPDPLSYVLIRIKIVDFYSILALKPWV
jgi:hypothetical protein